MSDESHNYKIAKYRKCGNDKEWWLTNFTVEQVERRLKFQFEEIARLRARVRDLEDRLAPVMNIKEG